MQNEKDLFNLIKEIYPQNPSKDFIVSTENKLRQHARSMNRKSKVKKVFAISSGILLFAFTFSWLFLFSGKDVMTAVINGFGEESMSATIEKNDPLVFIYHSHNMESFIPEINGKAPNYQVISETKNVTLIGKELSRALKDNNINSIHDGTNIAEVLKERNLSFADSYIVSREQLQNGLDANKSIKMVFDIHRDSQNRKATTININGQDYARIVFVVSTISDNYKKNRDFAMLLHEKLEELYPGLSRGVVEKEGKPRNTYNQDVLDNSSLLEIGGVENTLEETYRTTEVLAKVIKEVIDM
ncbi:stage II sporulation protein P [Solibacillus sp. CAU 1738]|uniref:stage II sporulation protein P n=1 Tax=Solibacillus sp. CAU 1738 TaxID=3140363 RepID=UPI0032601670